MPISSMAAAIPPSSLRVELAVSYGPSTGPAPSNNTWFVWSLTCQPNVPWIPLSPPSEEIVRHSSLLHICWISASVFFCLTCERSRRCERGRDLILAFRVSFVAIGLSFSPDLTCFSSKKVTQGDFIQYRLLSLTKSDRMYFFQSLFCVGLGGNCLGQKGWL